MKKLLAVLMILVVVAIVVYIGWRPVQRGEALPPVDYSTALLTKPYQNDTFKFSLSTPENFEVRQLADDGSGATTLLIESADRADGVQIIVSPFDEALTVLTEERIKQDVPDMMITDSQRVEIGDSHTGLAFKSDNEAFDGASREVWFVFRGNLYQISTYERLDPLLKKIFSTWKFF
jgi:hypothetical protein